LRRACTEPAPSLYLALGVGVTVLRCYGVAVQAPSGVLGPWSVEALGRVALWTGRTGGASCQVLRLRGLRAGGLSGSVGRFAQDDVLLRFAVAWKGASA